MNEKLLIKKTSPREEVIMDLGLLSKKQVAKMFRVESCTIDRWVKLGRLSPIKHGSTQQSKVYFKQENVLELLKSF